MLRLAIALTFTLLLTGCDAVEDVHKLKADVKGLKAYITSFPPPNTCLPPGTPQARICYYKLSVKIFDKQRGLYKGHVSPTLVKSSEAACKESREAVLKEYPEWQDSKCPNTQEYMYTEYGFKVEGAPTELKGDHEFVSIPHTEYLKLGKPDDTIPYQ